MITGISDAFDAYFINSKSVVDDIIRDFEFEISCGRNPSDVERWIFGKYGITSNSDLLPEDIRKIEREVNRFVERYQNA